MGATTLLHEAYLSLAAGRGAAFPDRLRFLKYASRAMRGLIIDYVRARRARKRGGDITFTDARRSKGRGAGRRNGLERLGQALDELATIDAALAELVDLKFFCGFSFVEIAELRGVSERTVQRDWAKARVLLHERPGRNRRKAPEAPEVRAARHGLSGFTAEFDRSKEMFRFDKGSVARGQSAARSRAGSGQRGARPRCWPKSPRIGPELAPVLARLLEDHDRLLGSDFLESGSADARRSVGCRRLLARRRPVHARRPSRHGRHGQRVAARAQRRPLRRSVAVKLLNLALLDREGDERFRREGTLLARLTHPHIARLLDAGVTVTGQPYLVLEYVEGIRDRPRSPTRSAVLARRLELFLQIAEAVAHAHANLIVHRDLKPSNILVAPTVRSKLLDFGIGKLLADGSRPATLDGDPGGRDGAHTRIRRTRTGARRDHHDRDRRLRLGVLLYVLLTGRHPTGAALPHVSRAPARRFSSTRRCAPAMRCSAGGRRRCRARRGARQSTPDRLRRLYRGDIDNVLAKALEKTPDQRYASVTALADDIRRFLHHEPLSVHGKSWTYRAAKFVRRHRWPVAAAVVAFATLAPVS